MAENLLQISDLYAGVVENKKEIKKGLNLNINRGEIHVIMGPNGAGKSTLSYVLTGRPDYEVTSGSVTFKNKDLLQMAPEERASEGIFLSMQYPIAIPGISVTNFLKHAVNAQRKYKGLPELDAAAFLKLLRTAATEFDISSEMLKREINVGFSGGEKKRLEILQMAMLQPCLTILDEADSGLDIDALKIVAQGDNNWHNKDNSLLIITHHSDLLNYIQPDFVHIYADGHIIKSGDKNLAAELEEQGYKNYLEAEKC